MSDKKENNKTIQNVAVSSAQYETVQRYGAAAKEHFVAYSGVDNETGERLSKGLKDISQSKTNPKYKDSNIKQQAGFSAEVKTQARENSERIIRGDKKIKTKRTDDINQQTYGNNSIGGTNDQLYDLVDIGADGSCIEGSARQLKYIGGNSDQCANKLLSRKFDKYRDSDVPIEVPSDFYDDVQVQLTHKTDKLKKQIEDAQKKGNTEAVKKYQQQLDRVEKTKKNLRRGALTNKEALEARLHPTISTMKDIHRISHRAGIEGAKMGVAVGGGVSAIQNVVSVIKGDESITDAVKSLAKDTSKSAVLGYATSYSGAALKGAMQNAPSEYLRVLSKTNLPATFITSAIEVTKTISKYGKGEIDGTDCLVELGEKGSGMLSSSMMAAVGQVVIPVPVVGGLIGGMVGYALSSAYYNELVNSLSNAKLAKEERTRIEEECKQSIYAIKEYRLQIELMITNYMQENIAVFKESFTDMEEAYHTGNIDQFLKGSHAITQQLGGNVLFNNQNECDALMSLDEKIVL